MSSSNAPGNLLIFTTSQSPLYIRFARPRKPNLILPPLIHRSLHSALDNDPPSLATTKVSGVSTIVIPDPDTLLKHDVPKFHNALAPADNSEGSDPNVDSQPPASHSALAIGDEVDAEVTVKIHLGGNATTTPEEKVQWVHEALQVLAERKGLQGVDTLLIGFRGVDYKGKKTAASEFFGCGAEGMEGGSGSDVVEDQLLQQVKSIWEGVSKDLSAGGGDERQTEVKTIGTLYLPLGALKELSETQYPPKINSLDTPDCHHLPQEYAGFAKERGIELWAGGGGEGSDPLPAADLHNLLNEFVEARPELLSGASDSTSGLLRKQIPLREDGLKYSEDVQRGVEINWILGYTLVSKTRNVLKDKGYIVSAKILG